MIATLLLASAALAQDDTPIEPARFKLSRPVSFKADVLPILRANCMACHNRTTNENDLILESVASIMTGGAEGPAVVPGKPESSLLYRVAARSAEPVMPPLPNDAKAKALTPGELGILKQWIVEGAKVSPAGTARPMSWRPISARLKAVHCVDYHETSGTVAAGRSNRVHMYDLHRQISIGYLVDPSLPGSVAHRDLIQSIAFHPTEPIMATGGYRTVKFWKQQPTATVSHTFDRSVQAYAANGDRVAVGFGEELQVFNAPTEAEPITLRIDQPVAAIALGASGSVAACSKTGQARYWSSPLSDDAVGVAFDVEPTCLIVTASSLVAGTADGRVLVANLDDSGKVAQLKSHVARVNCMTCTTEGRLISGAADGVVVEWDLSSGKSLRDRKLLGAVTSLAVSPDGKKLAAGSDDGTISVWAVADGKQISVCGKDLQQIRDLRRAELTLQIQERKVNDRANKVKAAKAEVASQTKTLATARKTVETTSKAATSALAKTTAEAKKIKEARKSLAAKPSDKGLKSKLDALTESHAKLKDASDNAERAAASAVKDVAIIESILDRAEKTAGLQQERLQEMTAQRDNAQASLAALKAKKPKLSASLAVRFETNNLLSSVDAQARLHTWNAASGEPLTSQGKPEAISSAKAAPGGFIGIDATRSRLMVLSSKPAWRLFGPALPSQKIAGRVRALAFSNDGRWLAAGSGQPSRSGQLLVWDADTRRLAQTIPDAHSDTVLDLEFSSDDSLLLSCGSDKFAKSWKVSDGSFYQSYEGHTHHVLAATWQPDMTHVATGSGDNQIKVWDAETGEQRRSITTHRKHVTGLRFVGAEDIVISSCGDGTVRNFTAGNGRANRTYPGDASDYVHCVSTSQSGDVAVAGTESGTVRVWTVTDGKLLAEFRSKD